VRSYDDQTNSQGCVGAATDTMSSGKEVGNHMLLRRIFLSNPDLT
jgi:hypothetical protein